MANLVVSMFRQVVNDVVITVKASILLFYCFQAVVFLEMGQITKAFQTFAFRKERLSPLRLLHLQKYYPSKLLAARLWDYVTKETKTVNSWTINQI